MSEMEETSRPKRDYRIRRKSQPPTVPRSMRAGLLFPVGRCHRHIRDLTGGKMIVGGTAATYATATIEYLTAEVLLLAGNVREKQNASRLDPRHLRTAIKEDEELSLLVDNMIRATGKDHWKLFEDSDEDDEEPTPSTSRPLRRSPRIKPKKRTAPKRK